MQRSEVVAVGRIIRTPDVGGHLICAFFLAVQHALCRLYVDAGRLAQKCIVTDVHFLKHNNTYYALDFMHSAVGMTNYRIGDRIRHKQPLKLNLTLLLVPALNVTPAKYLASCTTVSFDNNSD